MNEYIPNGYFKTPRVLFESDVWTIKKAWCLKVWIYLCGKANHKDCKNFKRGYLLTSVPIIYADCNLKKEGISKYALEDFMRWLKKVQQITIQKTTRGVVLFVCKYASYQDENNYKLQTELQTELQTDYKQTTNDKQELKNERKNTESEDTFSGEKLAKEEEVKTPKTLSESELTEKISKLPADVNHEAYKTVLLTSFKATRVPTDVPDYLLNYDDREMMPLCVMLSLDNLGLREFAKEIYEKYKGGKRLKTGDPIKNYKTFFMNIVKADIVRLHKRFGVLTWM